MDRQSVPHQSSLSAFSLQLRASRHLIVADMGPYDLRARSYGADLLSPPLVCRGSVQQVWPGSSSSHQSTSSTPDVPDDSGPSGTKKRKRDAGVSDGPVEDQAELDIGKQADDVGNRKVVCPFKKRYPERFVTSRACSGPGFSVPCRLRSVLPFCLKPAHDIHRIDELKPSLAGST